MANIEMQNKIDEGTLLYNTLLNNVHKGNVDEMYAYFSVKIQFLSSYGYSKEKQMLNYCCFKKEAVINMYKKKESNYVQKSKR